MRNLAIALISVLVCVPVVSVLGQEKPKTDTQAKSETKPVSGSDTTKGKTNPANKENKEKNKEESAEEASLLRQRGLFLLRQAGDEAPNITDGAMAAQIQSKAAALLWDYDRETARKLFESAFDIAVRFYRDKKPVDQADKKYPNVFSHGDARMEVITRVSPRDPALGQKFTDQLLEEKKREQQEKLLQSKAPGQTSNPYFGKVDLAANDLLTSSLNLYQSDRHAAIDLATKAFSFSVPTSAPSFLAWLAGDDRAAADKLFALSLNRIASDESVPPGQLLLLSAYPFGEGQVWVTDGGGSSSSSFGPPKNFAIDLSQIAQFFSTCLTVMNRTADLNPNTFPEAGSRIGAALFMARLLQPKVNQFQGALSGEWVVLTNRLESAASPQTREGVDSHIQGIEREKNPPSNANNGNRISDLLNSAENATTPGIRDFFYQQAAIELDRTGETERALVIADKISDYEYRDKTKWWIYFDAATRAINDKRYDDARRYASLVDVVDQSAYLYSEIATAAIKDKDRARATEMLDESLKRISSSEDSMEKLKALLGIANVYSTFDTLRGFETAMEVVRTANRVPDYDSDQAYLVREISVKGRSGMTSVYGTENFDIGRMLTMLGRADFDRSLLLAQSFENRAVRLNSFIAIAASVIESKKRP